MSRARPEAPSNAFEFLGGSSSPRVTIIYSLPASAASPEATKHRSIQGCERLFTGHTITVLSAQSRTNAKENNEKKEIFVIRFIFLNFMQPIAT
jgi:hypothetical protein